MIKKLFNSFIFRRLIHFISIFQLKGMDHPKKIFIIHLREKCFKHKIISMSCQQMFVSRLFWHRTLWGPGGPRRLGPRTFRGSCRKCIFAYNFTDRTKFRILFHLQTLGAGRHIPNFFNFRIIKF